MIYFNMNSVLVKRSFLYFFLPLLLAHCDTVAPDTDDLVDKTLTATDGAFLTINNLLIGVDSMGCLTSRWLAPWSRRILFDSGIWLAGKQNGDVRATFRESGIGNYRHVVGNEQLGLFTLTQDSLSSYDITYWPAEEGAPTDRYGQPEMYGDMMVWSLLEPNWKDTYRDVRKYPLENITISQSIYGYSESNLINIVFIRYEITNSGFQDLSDMYAGFFTDIDIEFGGYYSNMENASGYEMERALSYTYPSEAKGDVDLGSDVVVVGHTFLESPISSEHPKTITSHTIFRKHFGRDPSGFGELNLIAPYNVLNMLKGQSAEGDPMIDPTNGQSTKFAFTGDPVKETGWLDTPNDVRSLLAAGPFSISVGEKKVLTVALIIQRDKSLYWSLVRLRWRLKELRERRELWYFDD